MFVAYDGLTHYCTDTMGKALVATKQATVATASQAADCVNRFVVNGNSMMNEVNEAFQRIYGKPLSAAESYKPIPNECMKGFSVAQGLREYEYSETFAHLFNPETGEVL